MYNFYNILCLSILIFLIGGIPFGYILCKLIKKIDIRQFGSGSIGATNVCRVIGKKYGIITFLLDGMKSFLPIFIIKQYFGYDAGMFFAFFAITGHIFSPWLKGKGGKGVASLILSMLAIDYRLFLIMVSIWLLCFFISKISALSALTSIFITVISSYFLSSGISFSILFIIACFIFYAHRSNIKRLLNGNELGFKKNK